MFIKVNSVNCISENQVIQDHCFVKGELIKVIKSIVLIIFCAVFSTSILLVYQFNTQPKSHFNRIKEVSFCKKMLNYEAVKHQYIPSKINIGKVEMGPFLGPICNIQNEKPEGSIHNKIDPIDVNDIELLSMVETKQ